MIAFPFSSLPGAAAEFYAQQLSWPVAQGTWITAEGACSCAEPSCPRPGGHPLAAAWWLEASTRVALVRELWAARPEAGVLVPTGQTFDVLDVPGLAGREAVHRLKEMGYRLGPVAVTGEGRMLLLVQSASRDDDPWSGADRRYDAYDVYRQAEGCYVSLPPSDGVRWLLPPDPAAPELPAADDIIGTVLQACLQVGRRRLLTVGGGGSVQPVALPAARAQSA